MPADHIGSDRCLSVSREMRRANNSFNMARLVNEFPACTYIGFSDLWSQSADDDVIVGLLLIEKFILAVKVFPIIHGAG